MEIAEIIRPRPHHLARLIQQRARDPTWIRTIPPRTQSRVLHAFEIYPRRRGVFC